MLLEQANGTHTMTHADGTVLEWVEGPDPRWGMHAPVVTQFNASTPGGVNYSVNTVREVTLLDANDPLNLESHKILMVTRKVTSATMSLRQKL